MYVCPKNVFDTYLRIVQALQDHEYMVRSSKRSRDPFLVTGRRKIDRDILEAAVGDLKVEGESYSMWLWENTPRPLVSSRTHHRFIAFVSRLVVAAIGAAFLIGPMWLMMLNTKLYTSLISTTVFVAAFGFLMACVLDAYSEVLSSTAAYAAVLVVFVALTTSS